MDWLQNLAPTLFNALTGNIPAAIGSAIGFINKEFGWNNSTADDVANKLKSLTPEQREQFEQLDVEFSKIEIQRLQIENQALQIQTADTSSARSMHSALKDATTPIISYIIIALFIAVVGYIFKFPIPKENANIVWFLVGQITGFAGAVVTFWVGSSKGSADKTDMLDPRIKN